MSDSTQNDAVLARLKLGPLTALQALDELGCLRLAGRVFDLRIMGYTIERSMIRTATGKHVGQYRLRP